MRACRAAAFASLLGPAVAMAENVQRPGPMVGCPLRNARAEFEKISRQGKLIVAKIKDRTRDVIPGFDGEKIRKVTSN